MKSTTQYRVVVSTADGSIVSESNLVDTLEIARTVKGHIVKSYIDSGKLRHSLASEALDPPSGMLEIHILKVTTETHQTQCLTPVQEEE